MASVLWCCGTAGRGSLVPWQQSAANWTKEDLVLQLDMLQSNLEKTNGDDLPALELQAFSAYLDSLLDRVGVPRVTEIYDTGSGLHIGRDTLASVCGRGSTLFELSQRESALWNQSLKSGRRTEMLCCSDDTTPDMDTELQLPPNISRALMQSCIQLAQLYSQGVEGEVEGQILLIGPAATLLEESCCYSCSSSHNGFGEHNHSSLRLELFGRPNSKIHDEVRRYMNHPGMILVDATSGALQANEFYFGEANLIAGCEEPFAELSEQCAEVIERRRDTAAVLIAPDTGEITVQTAPQGRLCSESVDSHVARARAMLKHRMSSRIEQLEQRCRGYEAELDRARQRQRESRQSSRHGTSEKAVSFYEDESIAPASPTGSTCRLGSDRFTIIDDAVADDQPVDAVAEDQPVDAVAEDQPVDEEDKVQQFAKTRSARSSDASPRHGRFGRALTTDFSHLGKSTLPGARPSLPSRQRSERSSAPALIVSEPSDAKALPRWARNAEHTAVYWATRSLARQYATSSRTDADCHKHVHGHVLVLAREPEEVLRHGKVGQINALAPASHSLDVRQPESRKVILRYMNHDGMIVIDAATGAPWANGFFSEGTSATPQSGGARTRAAYYVAEQFDAMVFKISEDTSGEFTILYRNTGKLQVVEAT